MSRLVDILMSYVPLDMICLLAYLELSMCRESNEPGTIYYHDVKVHKTFLPTLVEVFVNYVPLDFDIDFILACCDIWNLC